MAKIKDRKIFGFRNFRGLDKENKPLKVENFRASDGYNFVIDSGTLKTRPSFKIKDTLPFSLKEGEHLIDFYLFRDISIYVTNKGFRFFFDGVEVEQTSVPGLYTWLNLQELNFDGLNPLFQEEKEVLFIFCLNDIFVFSDFRKADGSLGSAVLYSLKNKPSNPYTIEEDIERYDKLPTAYEPTLFIGDNPLDDVNLLSNVSKYKLFANIGRKNQEEIVTYNLPTHYDASKNGDNPKIEVKFYNDRFKNLKVFPVYLGILGENFKRLDEYGELANENELEDDDNYIKLQETFIAPEPYEYFEELVGDTTVLTPIKRILGLTKEDFFKMRTKEGNQNTFEYLLNYIEMNTDFENLSRNLILAFELPYERTTYFRSKETNEIKRIEKEKTKETIYVQLKKYTENEITFLEKEIKTNKRNNTSIYPSFPSFTQTIRHDFEIFDEPIVKNDFIENNEFKSMVDVWLDKNKFKLEEIAEKNIYTGDYLTFSAKALIQIPQKINQSLTITPSYWNMVEYEEVDIDNANTYPPHLGLIPIGKQQVDIGILFTKNRTPITDTSELNEKLTNYLLNNFELLDFNLNEAYVIFRTGYYYEVSPGVTKEYGGTFLARVDYSHEKTIYQNNTQTLSMITKIIFESTEIFEDLYTVNYDKSINSFVLKCKDYFFDFNNEPSIEVIVTFEKNPDYEIIANSRFGIAFGSENRLFLAGNEKYPHIDRFNVSNDLLGNNKESQSYELSYFPSKNYRILGGKGAINGYVIATDSQLYVTKENYPNDSKLFIRERKVDEDGLVVYFEYKTNINRTPLNNKCLIRFYNDILMLTKDGLFGLEISSNVLTNERMIKLRSGFINKDLIENSKVENVFMTTDEHKLYIVCGKVVYVADARYTAINENNIVENISYELVKWLTPFTIKKSINYDNEVRFVSEEENFVYGLEEDSFDDNYIRNENSMYSFFDNNINLFVTSDFILEKVNENSQIIFEENIYKREARNSVDFFYNLEQNRMEVVNEYVFRNLKNGDTVYYKNGDNFVKTTIKNFEENDRESFQLEGVTTNFTYDIYIYLKEKPLYVDKFIKKEGVDYILISPYKVKKIENFEILTYNSINSFPNYGEIGYYYFDNANKKYYVWLENIQEYDEVHFNDYVYYIKKESNSYNFKFNNTQKIRLKWLSNITSLDNHLYEKTLFKTNIYANKQFEENIITIGYKTMRRHDRFDENSQQGMMKMVDVSNPFDFEEVDFNIFALNTLSEIGTSLPTKESNFLYVQFLIIGDGSIEINAIELTYKLNRLLKTIS